MLCRTQNFAAHLEAPNKNSCGQFCSLSCHFRRQHRSTAKSNYWTKWFHCLERQETRVLDSIIPQSCLQDETFHGMPENCGEYSVQAHHIGCDKAPQRQRAHCTTTTLSHTWRRRKGVQAFRRLWVPFLAATPCGVVGDDTLVEIKCPYAQS